MRVPRRGRYALAGRGDLFLPDPVGFALVIGLEDHDILIVFESGKDIVLLVVLPGQRLVELTVVADGVDVIGT